VHAFLLSFGVIFVAELGDKSQLMAMAFSARYKPVPVLIGITAATAGVTPLIANTAHQNWGKKAWEYVNGQTSDPGGFLDVTVSLLDFNATEPGDVSVYLVYQVE